MTFPILTNELARRIERTDSETMKGRMESIQSRKDNPFGVSFKQFGDATAFMAKGIPITDFNKIVGFSNHNVEMIDDMKSFYGEHSLQFGIDVIPADTNPDMLKVLSEKGFVQSGFHTAFYSVPRKQELNFADGVEVKAVTQEKIPEFTRMFLEGNGLPPDIAEGDESFSHLLANEQWRLYIGYVDERPAGFAMLHIAEDGVGCLAQAATVPQLRGRGCQAAMLARRMHDAEQAGCHLITATATFGKTSFRNLQKAGLQIAFTKAIYTSIN